MAAQQMPVLQPLVPFAPIAETLSDGVLPDGWSIVDYPGRRGCAEFAVFANGRRVASGMTNEVSAARWARLLSSARR